MGSSDFAVNASGQAFWADNVSGTVGRRPRRWHHHALRRRRRSLHHLSRRAVRLRGYSRPEAALSHRCKAAPQKRSRRPPGSATSIATDDTFVYWADNVVLSEDAGTVSPTSTRPRSNIGRTASTRSHRRGREKDAPTHPRRRRLAIAVTLTVLRRLACRRPRPAPPSRGAASRTRAPAASPRRSSSRRCRGCRGPRRRAPSGGSPS